MSLGRQLVDDLGQVLAKALQQIIARHAGLRRCYRLVRPSADPRIDGIAMAALLKLFEQVVQAATQDAAGSAACGNNQDRKGLAGNG